METVAGKPVVDRLVFALNGLRYEVAAGDVDPSMPLLEFIRTRTPFKGPKLGCGEGGCGACVVLIAKYNPAADEVTEFSASSCLTLLYSINFCSVITTEGLGNTQDGFHAVQKRMSGFHASQCGFCTPGMCMSIFSSLINADKSKRPEPLNGFSKLTVSEAEKAFSGNLCRCTGYRPIVDACKSFASDVDLEDLGLNIFWKRSDRNPDVSKLPSYTLGGGICTFPDFLKSEIKSSLNHPNDACIAVSREGWYHPRSIKQYYELINSGLFGESTKVVVGNTSTGVYKDQDLYNKYIDIGGIPELSNIVRREAGIEIGAATTVSRTIEILQQGCESIYSPNGSVVFRKLAEHMSKVATPFVRNTASLGGNLILAQKYPFPSDIATILLGAGSTVCLQVVAERRHITLEQFLQQPPLDTTTLLLNIFIPHWVSDSQTETNLVFETYRAAPRPLGNAVSYVNSAFLGHVSLDELSDTLVLSNLHLAFGAYGTEHAIRTRKVEKFLTGKSLTASIVLGAIQLLRETIVPMEGTSHPEYRVSAAVGFLFSFLSPLSKGITEPGKTLTMSSANSADTDDVCNLPLSSRRETISSDEYKPVGEPIKKYGVEIQASGEAVYVDDIPAPKNCLYGEFIYSTQPFAYVKSIKFKSSLASEKIIAVVSAKDIPSGGQNIGSTFMFGDEPLFGDPIAQFAGQALAVVIAETQRYADMAAKQAVIEYDTKDLSPPILTVEQAVENNSYFKVPPDLYPKEVGDVPKGMAEADHKIPSAEVKLASEYYFYMETQTALAIPDEDNTLVVYSSSQDPELAQSVIAKCLGIPFSNVRVITRRVGGGFGGKAFRSFHVATAAAVCAYKLRRPVRMYLNRNTDMVMVGGRHPVKANYSVGFKSDGKITALHLDLLINAGISEDASPIIPGTIISSVKKYNWGALSFDIKLCKTNNTSKSVMRAPGDTQGSLIADAIIEHVASVLSVDANSVREKNFHSYDSLQLFYPDSAGEASTYTLHSIFDRLVSTSSYLDRAESIKQFNKCNKWRKRGISCVPLIFNVEPRAAPGRVSVLNDGSIVVEVGGIEIGQGLWTKVQQMTAFALGQLWPKGCEGLLERVRVLQADTLNLIQGGLTAGSTTSESSCAATLQACNMLIDRLKPVMDRLQLQSENVSWDTLISQASQENVNLSASAYWVPGQYSNKYVNYGAGISEVEIDLLTGAVTLLRGDLVYDCGKSMNPAVDLGQIEGSFIQGIGFFIYEEYLTNSDGLMISNSTWDYKIPSVDTIPKQFNAEVLNTGIHKNRVLSSKASGEPALVLASSVHCALREAIRAARKEFANSNRSGSSPLAFQMDVPAPMTVVKELCGFDIVDKYLESLSTHELGTGA
ncbi:putative aldehyde oxidase-like protein isoform X1 [Phragmites australis]|uniref:putative aldehyde oxidase-like protein isoform X1 n=2 Tax=Phragmites australis TaxID=29695 RepID=UPI002D77DDAD|nr:putative aldehyde oxidase-like protein isoform X1 [Phragmites australis]